jgi:hypothetical protein
MIIECKYNQVAALTDHDEVNMLIAALMHDIYHPYKFNLRGFTNSYLI